jgi:hypothetical protein
MQISLVKRWVRLVRTSPESLPQMKKISREELP